MLEELRSAAEKHLKGAEVSDVVITVPAYFNDDQRQVSPCCWPDMWCGDGTTIKHTHKTPATSCRSVYQMSGQKNANSMLLSVHRRLRRLQTLQA